MNDHVWKDMRAGRWNAPEVKALTEPLQTHPSMISNAEKRILWHLASQMDHGDGAIADLGVWLGGSTLCFAAGLAHARKARGRAPVPIHSYDRFRFRRGAYRKHMGRRATRLSELERPGIVKGLPGIKERLGAAADMVEFHEGDFMAQTWPDLPISVLFVDIAKTPALNDHVLEQCFARLRPGSAVVQQDFVFEHTPWLFWTMNRLMHRFELVAHGPFCTAVFALREPLTEADLDAAKATGVDRAGLLDAIDAFDGRLSGPFAKAQLQRARARAAEG